MPLQHFAILASMSFGLVIAAVPSRAATTTAAVAVSATVAPLCHVGPERHALAVTCAPGVPHIVTLDDGADPAPTGRVAATITY